MITVMITGHAGEGKSTIAVLIAKCLEDNGINVQLIDDDHEFDRKEVDYTLQKRIASMAAKSQPVKVQTKQLARSPKAQ